MRPIETLSLLANLLAFLVLAVPPPRALRWMRHAALVALPLASAQMLIEGPRWQMIPAYVLAHCSLGSGCGSTSHRRACPPQGSDGMVLSSARA